MSLPPFWRVVVSEFIDQEFASLTLGDQRRDKRLRLVLSSFLASPKRSIKAACSGWAEAIGAYRLLNNPKVTLPAVLAPHQEATINRVREFESVALIQDTTELDFTRQKKLSGPGPLAGSSNFRRGFFLHTQFAVTEDRLPLGVYDTYLYAREDRDLNEKKINHHSLPIEEKESYRWLEGYRKACELAIATGGGTEIFSISDREGDIYEIFEQRELYLQQRGADEVAPAHWIVRTMRDRVLVEPDPEKEGKWIAGKETLFERSHAGTLLGEISFSVTHKLQTGKKITSKRKKTTHERSRREVKQEIRVTEVTPRIPYRPGGKKLKPVSYWVIEATETDPPEGEEPIHWVISTSYPVTDFAAAQRILRLYLARWDIEVFHRVLKTGCRIEELQLKTEEALRPCLAMYLIIAWRLLYLTHLGRECPELPCSIVFEEAEWKAVVGIAVKRKMKGAASLEGREPTLNEMIGLVGAFGGHLGRKNDGPPGVESIWQGMSRVRDFAIAWEVFVS